MTEVVGLWERTRAERNFPNEAVNIKCVPEEEMRTLNKQYRGKDRPTNVLTFSYPAENDQPAEHDVALCLPAAEQEAKQRNMLLKDYVALLLVHAFLHVMGMDHERSPAEATATKKAEQEILTGAGFSATTLFH